MPAVAPARAPSPALIAQSSTTSECASAVGRLESTLTQAVDYLHEPGLKPPMKAWFQRAMKVFRESCEQDRWPPTIIACMSSARDLASLADGCGGTFPPELQTKLQDRMNRAMHDITPELTQR